MNALFLKKKQTNDRENVKPTAPGRKLKRVKADRLTLIIDSIHTVFSYHDKNVIFKRD